MSYRYFVIADEDTVLGFRCAGIPGTVVDDASAALQALQSASQQHAGLVILTQEVADMLREKLDVLRFGRELPMVVEIPGPGGPLPDRRSLSDIIRNAIGMKV